MCYCCCGGGVHKLLFILRARFCDVRLCFWPSHTTTSVQNPVETNAALVVGIKILLYLCVTQRDVMGGPIFALLSGM